MRSALADYPLDEFLHLNPAFAHGFAVEHHDDVVFIGGRQTRTRGISNAGLNTIEPILQQLVRILIPTILLRADNLPQQPTVHELTGYLGNFVTGRHIFELVIRIIAVAVDQFGLQSAHLLASLVHQTDKEMCIVFVGVGLVPSIRLWVHRSVLAVEEGEEADRLTQGNRCIVAAGKHHPVQQLEEGADLTLEQLRRSASYEGRGLSYAIGHELRVELVGVEEMEGCDSSDHFGETGYLPNFMYASAIVIHMAAILPLPHAPALGRDLRHPTVITEQLQKVAEIFHTPLALPTRASLCLGRAVVLPVLPQQGELGLFALEQLRV